MLGLSKPVFSIVTPNWNGRPYLRQCLDSVFSQNYPALEYIVVDGESTDGSSLVLEEYRDRLHKLICERDTGHADALNKGFAASSGEIMGWINSDDVILPGTLSFVARLFELYPDIEWITGRPSSMNADGEIEWMGQARPWSRLRFLTGDYRWIQQESTFWRRSLWERAGGQLDTAYALANDFELWCRFFRYAELHTVDRQLGCFRVRPGQRSVVYKARYESEAERILTRELELIEPAFKESFSAILPEKQSGLNNHVGRAMDPALAFCDPPLIRPSEIRSKKRAVAYQASTPQTHSTPLDRARAPSNLARFKDAHFGQRCFILGNGPSLNNTNLEFLADETVFACNAIYLLFDRIDWRPTYYTCVDSRVLPDQAAAIAQMLDSNPAMTGFFPAEIQEHTGRKRRYPTRTVLPSRPNRFYFREVFGSLDNLPDSMFSNDITEGVIQPHTVTITMLQIAAFMGFQEIYLVGCDTKYKVPDSAKQEDEDGLALTSTRDDDPNHFDPTYFGKGRKWHKPNTNLMVEHYKIARQALENAGVKVFNATVGGELEVFDRVDFGDLFDAQTLTFATRSRSLAASRNSALPAISGESLLRSTPKAVHAPLLSAWRNRTFIALLTVGAAAFALSLFLLPADASSQWLWPIGLFGFSLACTAAVAIKARRLLNQAHQQITQLHQKDAAREFRYCELESQLEDVRARLEELGAEEKLTSD